MQDKQKTGNIQESCTTKLVIIMFLLFSHFHGFCLGLRSKSHRISCPVSISAVDKVHAWEILSNSSGFSFVCKVVADLFTKSFRQTNQTKSRRLSCVFLIKLLSSNEISTGCFFFFSFFFFCWKDTSP